MPPPPPDHDRPEAEAEPLTTHRRGLSWRYVVLRLLLGLLVAGLLVLAWGTWAAVGARSDLLAARQQLEGVRDAGSLQDDLGPALALARADAERAADRLSSPAPRLLAATPVLGRSWRATRAVARAAVEVLATAERATPALRELDGPDGAVSLPSLEALADGLQSSAPRVEASLAELQDVPLGATPPPVRRAVEDARRLVVDAEALVRQGASASRAAHGLLGGSGNRTLVVGIMNNAELRGAGGYVSSFTVVRTQDGVFSVDPFTDVNAVQATPARAVRVPAPPDFTERYGRYLADTTLWKNVAMSPHAPDSAQVMCEVARLAPGIPCDGAVLLDIPALAELMELAGPVRVGDGLIEGDELVEALLVEAYADVVEQGGSQTGRREELLAAADAALPTLLAAPVASTQTLRALGRAAQGRHLAVWSGREDEQAALVRAGLAGSADPQGADLSLFAANQVSNSKLDYYVEREVGLDVEVSRDVARVTQTLRLSLELPDGLPEYVLGPRGRLDELLELSLADTARSVSLLKDGVPQDFELDRDVQGASRVTDLAQLVDGQSLEYVLAYEVPLVDGRYRAEVLPQPLARDATLRLRVRAADGLVLEEGPLEESGPLSSSRSLDVRAASQSWWDRPVTRPW